MSTPHTSLSEARSLAEELDTLTRRVEALESRIAWDGTAGSSSDPHSASLHAPGTGTVPRDDSPLWALDGLRARLGERQGARGEVMLLGALTLPDGGPVAWQQGADADDLLELDWGESAAAFAALGHPVRLELLRQILGGAQTTAELAEADSLGTTGQLHHHLRQLLAAGWLAQSGRGRYEVPAARIVPLLACVTGAKR